MKNVQNVRYFVFVLLLTLSVGVPGGAQEPDPHALAYCVNHAGFPKFPMEEPHICTCDSPCNEGDPEDRKCLVYCRKDHCHCIAECER